MKIARIFIALHASGHLVEYAQAKYAGLVKPKGMAHYLGLLLAPLGEKQTDGQTDGQPINFFYKI